jgi:hypothetical protein
MSEDVLQESLRVKMLRVVGGGCNMPSTRCGVALRRREKDNVPISPPCDLRFEVGDVLIALGTRDRLQRLSHLASDSE